jgi:hypothetical protein
LLIETPEYKELSPMRKELLDDLQKGAFNYFIDQVNPQNGLVADSLGENSPSSIDAIGFSLPIYSIGVQHGWMRREEAVERTLAALRFFSNYAYTPDANQVSYQGFYYHFLDMKSGERVWQCELSTIDTTILISGMLAAQAYYQQENAGETEIRLLTDRLYRQVNWQWAMDGGSTVTHGWKPESGFLTHRWQGYDEAMLLYVLGLGSPTYPLPASCYHAWTSTFRWEILYDIPFLFAGPLFVHEFSHIWIDFRGIQDRYMSEHHSNYFENSRKAAYINRQYAIQNPHGFTGYGKDTWGISASEGPIGDAAPAEIDGNRFWGYLARGVPGPDDGTLSPWTVITSLPFAPEITLPAIENYLQQYPHLHGKYGMLCSINLTYPTKTNGLEGWYSDNNSGLNEGPVVLMIENFRNGFVWELMKRLPYISSGLKRAGFSV